MEMADVALHTELYVQLNLDGVMRIGEYVGILAPHSWESLRNSLRLALLAGAPHEGTKLECSFRGVTFPRDHSPIDSIQPSDVFGPEPADGGSEHECVYVRWSLPRDLHPLHFASGMPHLVPRWVASGASPDVRDADGRTPLMLCRCPQVAEQLLLCGADPAAVDAAGVDVATHVAEGGDAEVVRIVGAALASGRSDGAAG